jgi:uncharacterized protein (TIGR03032 family)
VSDDARFAAHGAQWRDPHAVIAQWSEAGEADPELLRFSARGGWWEALEEAGVTLLVSREYEHLVLAIAPEGPRRISYLRLPHPSGIAFDPARETVAIASTRNPNQLYLFAPVSAAADRADAPAGAPLERALVPVRSWYLPGSTYLHDLALIGGRLHGNAVGRNAVVVFEDDGARAVWWPAALERDGRALGDRNYVQLNSIAGGADLASSFFSASGERPGSSYPGDPEYPVDGRGVIFSGATREPVVRGLTRPHSARLHGGSLWVANSGYGELGAVRDGRFERLARLPGWTRGLAFAGGTAFAGTSRVIPRFRAYAPGLDLARSRCAIHAVDVASGRVRGSLEFPHGNQIFAIEPVPRGWTSGFPFVRGASAAAARRLFYAYAPGARSSSASGGPSIS